MYVVYKYIYEKLNEYLLFLLMFVIANVCRIYVHIEKMKRVPFVLLMFVIANVCRIYVHI